MRDFAVGLLAGLLTVVLFDAAAAVLWVII